MPTGIESKKMAKTAAAVTGNGGSQATESLKSLPERIKFFYNDVRTEMRKVTSPSRKEVQATTAVVIITVFLFAAYFYGVDRGLGFAIDSLLKWAKTAERVPSTQYLVPSEGRST